MGPKALFSSILSLFFLATLASASTFLSHNTFNQAEVFRRSTLVKEEEALKACSIDFKNQNYSGVISQCKGPNYSPESCCKAFKEFACPFKDYINDLSTDCAYSMFYYINLYGHYPEGLFYNKCITGGSKGLECSSGKQ